VIKDIPYFRIMSQSKLEIQEEEKVELNEIIAPPNEIIETIDKPIASAVSNDSNESESVPMCEQCCGCFVGGVSCILCCPCLCFKAMVEDEDDDIGDDHLCIKCIPCCFYCASNRVLLIASCIGTTIYLCVCVYERIVKICLGTNNPT
jgi:hypothetical protein